MSTLLELLGLIKSDDEILEENLGNLNFIDKKFRGLLQQIGRGEYKRQYKGSGTTVFSKSKGFSMNLGQDVIVKEDTVKTAADISKLLKEEKLQLLTLEADGIQLVLIRKYQFSGTDYRYEFFIDSNVLLQHVSEEREVELHSILQKSKFIENHSWKLEPEKVQSPISESGVYGQITTLIKALKETDLNVKEIKATSVFPDERRLITHREREDRKRVSGTSIYSDEDSYGKMPLKLKPGQSKAMADNDYNKLAKAMLNVRLEKFKKTKTTDLNSAADLVEQVKEKGFEPFIKIKGITYKLDNMEYMNYSNFTDNSRSRPNVSYRVDEETPEYQKAYEKSKRMKDLFDVDTEEGLEEYREARERYMPPRYIKLELMLGKGGIVVKGLYNGY